MALMLSLPTAGIKVHTIGDSTMANYEENRLTRGWGNAEEYSAKHTRKMKKAYMVFRHKSIVVALGCPKKIRMGDFACRGGRMKM